MADEVVRVKVVIDEDVKGAKRAKKAVDEVTESTEKLGDQFDLASREASSFDDRLKALTDQRAEYARKAIDADDHERKAHVQRYSAINREIGLLRKLKAVADEATDTGGKVFQGGDIGFGGLAAVKGPAIGLLVGAAVAAAPAIGAVVAGAVGGAGLAVGLAGGIFAASKDAQVREAARGFGAVVSSEFFSAGQPFVAPAVEGLSILKRDFQDLNLDESFARAAPAVTIVAEGLGNLAKNFMPGFNRLLDESVPLADSLAAGLSDTGAALSSLLTDVAESPGTVEGLDLAFDLLNGTVRGLGNTLNVLGDGFDWVNRRGAEITGVAEDAAKWIPFTGGLISDFLASGNDRMETYAGTGDAVVNMLHRYKGATEGAAGVTGVFGEQANEAAARTRELRDALYGAFNAQISADEATIAWEKSLDELTDAVKENGTSIDATTEKGRTVRQALDDAAQAALRHRDANIKAGMSADEANAQYDKEIKKLEALAVKLGIAKDAAKDLAGKYTVEIATAYTTQGNPKWNPGNGMPDVGNWVQGRAGGGSVLAGVPYRINERGSETVTFPAGGMVHPANLTPAMASSGSARPVNITINGSGLQHTLLSILFNEFVREVGNRGGTLAVLGIRD